VPLLQLTEPQMSKLTSVLARKHMVGRDKT